MIVLPIVLLGLVASVSADELPEFLEKGKCSKVPNQDKFDLRRYGGRWYQTEIIKNPFMEFTKCINSFYDYSEPMMGYNLRTAGYNDAGQHSKQEGKIYSTDKFPAAHMLIDIETAMGHPYEIIETDYESYSCVYSCIEWNAYKTEFGFIFSRSPENNGPATQKCQRIFKKHGIDSSKFITVPHTSDCVYRA